MIAVFCQEYSLECKKSYMLSVPLVLKFLQFLTDQERSALSLKVYVVAILRQLCWQGHKGSNTLVSCFLRQALRLHHSCTLILSGTCPWYWMPFCVLSFEPRELGEMRWLSLKQHFFFFCYHFSRERRCETCHVCKCFMLEVDSRQLSCHFMSEYSIFLWSSGTITPK